MTTRAYLRIGTRHLSLNKVLNNCTRIPFTINYRHINIFVTRITTVRQRGGFQFDFKYYLVLFQNLYI